jgi:hypothetical protein
MNVYYNGDISIGYAKIASMDKFDFEFLLTDNNTSIRGPSFE